MSTSWIEKRARTAHICTHCDGGIAPRTSYVRALTIRADNQTDLAYVHVSCVDAYRAHLERPTLRLTRA